MAAHFIPIGTPAHDNERQALRFLVEGLPAGYTVFGNPWLVENTGVVYELDAIVVAPHAIFVVEIKSYRGRIEGTDHDWYIPEPVPSPLKLNRLTSQVLNSRLRRESYAAGQVWVQGLVFLSATTDLRVQGPASRDRIHTRKSLLGALQDEALIRRLSGRTTLAPSSAAENDLLRVLTADQRRARPVRRVREYEILGRLDHHETFTELLGKNTLSDVERVLRIYTIPPLATEAERERVVARARWEAQVLGRLGKLDGVLNADPPFSDEAGIVLPLEHFRGITLTTWIERYGPGAKGKDRADLHTRTDLWMRIAETIDDAHRQGVVHRLLRPEVIFVEDRVDPTDQTSLRVTGFDLAKQLAVDTSISLTTLADERLVYAAPEVVTSFSSAEPASDQFSLGAILALLLAGKPLFDSTRKLLEDRRLIRRVRDMAQRVPLSLDEAVTKMVEIRPTDRYPSLLDAVRAVEKGREPETRTPASLFPERKAVLDADNLAEGTRIGTDYEIGTRLGQGGLAVVYAAKHLVSGRTRALKIAKPEDSATDALQGEYQVLSTLDHPNVVKVIDLTKMVDGRLTLVMERVSGETLRTWLGKNPTPEPPTQRRLAEDLLAGLDYLEQKGITHKDLKPDNLLVSEGRLVLIDFSLAAAPEDAAFGGSALYRDPASARWSHATDRYAAALCLFELYAGRHAFDGHVPAPGQAPSAREEDIDPPGLAAFFRKALDPAPEKRFPSARAMRDALLVALGEDVQIPEAATPVARLEAPTPVELSGLSRRAVNALLRSQVRSVGEMLALSEEQVRNIHAIGTKTASEVIALQQTLRERGLTPASGAPRSFEPPLLRELMDCPEPLTRLPISTSVRAALEQVGFPTIGAVASLTRTELMKVSGIGPKRLVELVEALHRFHKHAPGDEGAHTLDRLWELASGPLSERERLAVERCIGLLGEPETQGDIARDLGRKQSQLSGDLTKGLSKLDMSALGDPLGFLDNIVGFSGITRLDELGRRFEEQWPAGVVTGPGMARLLVRISAGRAQVHEVDGVDAPLVVRPAFDRETLRAFVAEVRRLAKQWPPVEPEPARRTLEPLLPYYEGDPLLLGISFCEGVRLTETGHLFVGPIDPAHSIDFVLAQARDPIPLSELPRRIRSVFGDDTPVPDADRLMEILRACECRVQGDVIVPGKSGSVLATDPAAADPLPAALASERSPEQVVCGMLRDAASSRGFRMLVTPPEKHAEIARSVAQALGAAWLSFEDAFFGDHGADLPALERAERFVAQRDALTEAAEQTLFRLLEEHGGAGKAIVLGDTALFGLCEALDLPRRLYDETLSGSHGFWVLVVPGVIQNRQPRFNEGPPMWHLEGATLPLLKPIPS